MIRVLTRGSAAVLVLGSVACSDISGVGNDASNLSSSEVQNLALGVSALATTSADDRAWEGAAFSVSTLDIDAALHRGDHGGGGSNGGAKAGPGVGGALFGGIWGPRGLGRHGTTTTTIERSGPCPRGGTLESVTTITAVVDSVAQTGTITTESIDTPDACAFGVRNRNTVLLNIAEAGTVITVTGAPSLVTETSSSFSWASATEGQRGRFVRTAASGSHTGSFTYSTSDGRSGTCAVDLDMSFDPDTRTHTVKGTFCGHAVDISHTLPGRRL